MNKLERFLSVTLDAPHLALLLLRVIFGGMVLFHGIAKLDGIAFIKMLVISASLPEFVAYGVYIGEIVAPVLIILGLFTRIGGLILAFNMLVAIIIGHGIDKILMLGKHGAPVIELALLFMAFGISIALLGAGRYSIDNKS